MKLRIPADYKESAAASDARRKYLREWKRKHPERVKLYQARYWEKKAAEAAELTEDQQEPAEN